MEFQGGPADRIPGCFFEVFFMQIEQPQIPNNELEAEAAPAAPANWKDIVRQHITGPVFSLAFHIFLLVLLGTLVIIAPTAIKDDIAPVQITEMEPVLPPPEEEPMPSDMTVMDTSSPNLDRYDSNEQQQMEEVGVTDVEVMTDRMNCRVLAFRKPNFTFWAGTAWTKAGEITTPEAWIEAVRAYRKGVAK